MGVSTVGPGKDYTSLSAWEAAKQAVLSAVEEAQIYAFSDTTAVVIDGWTTSATNYIWIHTVAGEGHGGYRDTAKYVLSNASADVLKILENYVRVEGLQLEQTTVNIPTALVTCEGTGASDIRLDTLLFTSTTSGGSGLNSGISVSDAVGGTITVNAYNCVAYNMINTDFPTSPAAGIAFTMPSFGVFNVYNCTAFDCQVGFVSPAATYKTKAINCHAHSSSSADFTGAFHASSNFNCSSDATAPGANSLINKAAGDVDFTSTTTTATTFLDIDSTSVLVGAGTDDPYTGVYSDDIKSRTRTSTWDIGANEFVAAGGATTRGMPFGAMSTAFNGGRTFVGNIR